MRTMKNAMGHYLILLLVSYVLTFSYCGISQIWGEQGGTSSSLNLFELPLILLLSLILFVRGKRQRLLSVNTFLPLAPVLGFYLFFDMFYASYLRAPRISDLQNFPSLFNVSLPLAISALLLICLALGPVIVSNVKSCLYGSVVERVFSILRISCLIPLFAFLVSPAAYRYQNNFLEFPAWSTTRNIAKNGRVSFFIYMHNKRREIIANLEKFPSLSIPELFYKEPLKKKPDIHLLVLESFLDPREIKGLSFSGSPLHPQLSPYLNHQKEFSLIRSPVYGGGTAQSEFELLTGIPALALVDSIEFNLFEGERTSSFVEALNQNGYYTMASIGTRPKYYNSKVAYKGLGFQEITFLKEGHLNKAEGDDFIFDGDLFNQSLKHIEELDKRQPLFNYLVGMYGHLPYRRNLLKRPDVITINHQNEALKNITNQFYYRTEALAQFIETIFTADRDAIILVVSDHLPPVFIKGVKYKNSYRANIALLKSSDTTLDISGAKYYELPHILWKILQGSNNPSSMKRHVIHSRKKEIYFSFIREAMALPKEK